jgi:hypothetical protein
MVSAELLRCSQQALAAVAREAARGAPLVKCQLLASGFYEALKRELAQAAPADAAVREVLMAAAIQCLRAARTSISPSAMVEELEQAVIMLQGRRPTPRPFLHVIEGGRSGMPPLEKPARRLRGI